MTSHEVASHLTSALTAQFSFQHIGTVPLQLSGTLFGAGVGAKSVYISKMHENTDRDLCGGTAQARCRRVPPRGRQRQIPPLCVQIGNHADATKNVPSQQHSFCQCQQVERREWTDFCGCGVTRSFPLAMGVLIINMKVRPMSLGAGHADKYHHPKSVRPQAHRKRNNQQSPAHQRSATRNSQPTGSCVPPTHIFTHNMDQQTSIQTHQTITHHNTPSLTHTLVLTFACTPDGS